VYANSVVLTMQSSIVADNFTEFGQSDIDGPASVTGNHNLITSSTLPLPLDTITACPQLVGLADNGGVTLTHSLKHTSPAIDHGNGEQFPADDQRGPGFPRPIGAGGRYRRLRMARPEG
jgi:hypothetical protein